MQLLRPSLLPGALLVTCSLSRAHAFINTTETALQYVLSNDRLYAAVNKSTGSINVLKLDGQDLLGASIYGGPYLDCYCESLSSYNTWPPTRPRPRPSLEALHSCHCQELLAGCRMQEPLEAVKTHHMLLQVTRMTFSGCYITAGHLWR